MLKIRKLFQSGHKSLLLRVGIAVAVLFLLSVTGMVSSIVVADTMRGFAAAINHAGTLRMQSYRIASSLVHGLASDANKKGPSTEALVDEFEQRLFSPRIHNVLSKNSNPQVIDAYQTVEQTWQQHLQTRLRDYVEQTNNSSTDTSNPKVSALRNYYLARVDTFVNDIHQFVKVLELDAEQNNKRLLLIQVISLILASITAAFSVYFAHSRILIPLHDLLRCANAARGGDFTARSHYVTEDELGQLGSAFNVMAEDLSKIYTDLERRVDEKTADLERSNRSLELLYSATTRLGKTHVNATVLQELIHDIEQVMGAISGTICLGKPGDTQAFRMAFTRDVCDFGNAGHRSCICCLVEGSACLLEGANTQTMLSSRLLSTPISDQKQQYGVLIIELPSKQVLEEWQQRLLEAIASHIAVAINLTNQESQNRSMALMEERSVIARELHDSLAQTLSYLKIQVSRLDLSVARELEKSNIQEIITTLREALNGAYHQLRELLKTFRLRINEKGLERTLEETVQEFRERGSIEIELSNRLTNCNLDPNAEIHVVQIIRESLSNVVRHSQATDAKVALSCEPSGEVTVQIEDNGVGVHENKDLLHHYGISIMQERSAWLGGELTITPSKVGGTKVELTFSAVHGDHSQNNETLIASLRHE